MRRTVLAIATIFAVTAPAASAAIPQRYFAVSVKGVQTTTSSYTHASTGPCDPSDSSTSKERVVFHSIRSKVILATLFDNLGLVAFGKGQPKERDLTTLASITHQNHTVHGTVAPSCQGNGGGGGTAPTPDCGTRIRKLSTEFAWLNPRGIQLQVPDYSTYGHPFRNCTVSGAIFPQLLAMDTHGTPIYAHIPAAELFDHAWHEHILVGGGRFVSSDAEGGYVTTLRWEVRLRAVPPPWNPHARVY